MMSSIWALIMGQAYTYIQHCSSSSQPCKVMTTKWANQAQKEVKYFAPAAWLVSDKGQIQPQVVWALNLSLHTHSATLPLFTCDRLIIPTMTASLEGWTKFCAYLNRCLMHKASRVAGILFRCAWLVQGCKHQPGYSRAEGKQPWSPGPPIFLLFSPAPWDALAAPWPLHSATHTAATHSLCPFPSATSIRFALLPSPVHSSCQALQLSSLKPAGAKSGHLTW